MALIARETQAQIAKELTLSLISRINPTDKSTSSAMNESLAQEVAIAYEVIFKKIREVTE
ncbi:hypothetical protein [Bacillus sp. 3255]|uniref:hypothetical protein n=1 Tax=Bacillus sp. 3255 TaxID=2817904 RepID=UPI0028605634|nr:hypothetical protein [Bacillus sp. 3255]MDR6883127.1 hypothetical protein [Bacillus sp. 3255]